MSSLLKTAGSPHNPPRLIVSVVRVVAVRRSSCAIFGYKYLINLMFLAFKASSILSYSKFGCQPILEKFK
jgi:hypothetical protein